MEVVHEPEEDNLIYKPGGRLDMSHGFLHHIRKNQIARDDYDREVKEAKQHQKRRHTATPQRPRRPDKEVYHPRHRNTMEAISSVETEEWTESSYETEHHSTGTGIFWLDYQANSGKVTSFLVYKEDLPENVVERVEQNNVLDSALRAALLARIEHEINKRIGNHLT